jgi:hypothetical protein
MKSAIFTRPDPTGADDPVDAETVLDNVVELDRLLDEGSRREVDALPVLELSKHMRVRAAAKATDDDRAVETPGSVATDRE